MAFLGLGRRPTGVGVVPDSLTAAGFRVGHDDTDQLRRLIQPWQSRAFSYYDQLGEIWYASQFYARMMSPLRLYAAERNADGDYEETDDKDAVAALERIQDPGGGRESLLSSYGRLMFIAGETYLLCSLDPDTGLEQWEMLSTDELRVQSGIYVRYKAPSMAAEQLHEISDDDFEPIDKDTAVVYRLWRRHPRYTALADSPLKGVLDLCEELLILTRAVRARGRSRLAGNGLLAISEEFSHAPVEALPDEDAELDPFLRDLIDGMLSPIANEGAASAVIPIVIRGTTEAVEKGIKHIQLVDPTQLYPETGLRYECIKRIALGLDLPPEVLLGLQDSNHWSAWQVDEQTWKAHGQPASNQLVNDLTAAYFLPELRALGRTDWQRFRIEYDATAVVNHPDRTKDAKDLYDKRAIGKTALRDAAGFTDDDAPTKDELMEMIGVAIRDGSLAVFGIPSVKAGGIEPEGGEVIGPAGTAGTPEDDSAVSGADVEPGPPATENGGGEPTSVVGSALEAARVAGAADLALLRCRELAGNKMKSLAKRDPAVLASIANVRARDVCSTLGPEAVRRLAGTERSLIGNARDLIGETLALQGLPPEKCDLLADHIERHAIRTLYDERPSPLPPQWSSFVAGVLSRAG